MATELADQPLAGGSGWLSIPPPCEAGSRVGVIAPSGPVKPRLLSEGLRILREWGLVPVLYRSAESPDRRSLDESAGSVGEDVPFLETEHSDTSDRASRDGVAVAASLASTEVSGFLSGSDSVRAAELQAALADRSTRAVLCARGGHGAARLLPLVDWAAAAAGARTSDSLGFLMLPCSTARCTPRPAARVPALMQQPQAAWTAGAVVLTKSTEVDCLRSMLR